MHENGSIKAITCVNRHDASFFQVVHGGKSVGCSLKKVAVMKIRDNAKSVQQQLCFVIPVIEVAAIASDAPVIKVFAFVIVVVVVVAVSFADGDVAAVLVHCY